MAEDGDPLDVLLLTDEPEFTGCPVSARLVGVIEAEETEEGKTVRNGSLIGVAVASEIHCNLQTLKDIDANLVKEIGHSFASCIQIEGKEWNCIGTAGPLRAAELVCQGIQAEKKTRRQKNKKRART